MGRITLCNCGAKFVSKYKPPTSFLVKCIDCSTPLVDHYGNAQPVNVVPVLADRDDIRAWLTEGHQMNFINPDDRALVLLEVA